MAIRAAVIQVFTKTPNQRREPEISQTDCEAFRGEPERSGLTEVFAHDSYPINLASPDPS